MAPMREWTVRPNFRSPQQPRTRLSSRPFSRLMVSRSVRVWVGWWWPPSPALITGTVAFMEATSGAPSLGWRMAMMSAKQLTVRAVSATLSPLAAEELKLPSYVKKDALKEKGIPYVQTTDLEGAMPELDILCMTRVQRERFFNEEDYLRLKDSYILTPDKLRGAKADLSILHPLPRVNEISVAIDDDPRACYFKQVLNGKYMRRALIMKLLKEAGTL